MCITGYMPTRRVIDLDISDEAAHHKSGIAYLRRELPEEICNIRVDYYRLPVGHRRDEDSSGSEFNDSGVKAFLPAVLALFVLLLACTPGGLKRSERKVSREKSESAREPHATDGVRCAYLQS